MIDGDTEPGTAPYASGGWGTVLEHLYGASLLVGDPITELGDDATPVSVRFQGARLPVLRQHRNPDETVTWPTVDWPGPLGLPEPSSWQTAAWSMISTVRDLIERPVNFRYGYNMTCEHCGGITPLMADTYHRERHHAHIRCAHCPADIHYGPYAMTLRDADDPVLNDEAVIRAAWYHTSTVPGWPPRGRPLTPEQAGFLSRVTSDDVADSIRQRHEYQAVHLGTYEAAIESMLRKMRDEDAGGAQFWLYRVALRDRTMIKPGYCNETFEDISQITQEELGDWGAIRYLNTWESPGSISLAVRPQSLAAVQGIPLPVQALSTGAAPSLIREVARIRDQISQIEATRQDEPDWLEKTRQRLAARQGETLEREPTAQQQALDESIGKLIEDEYLPGVSLPVRENFSDAMSAWSQAQDPPVVMFPSSRDSP